MWGGEEKGTVSSLRFINKHTSEQLDGSSSATSTSDSSFCMFSLDTETKSIRFDLSFQICNFVLIF